LKSAHHVHLLNNASLSFLRESYGSQIVKGRYSIIPNGIDSQEYKGHSLHFTRGLKKKIGNRKAVVCISRWSFGKGIEHLVDAASLTAGQNPELVFVIAGKKANSWENSWKLFVSSLQEKIKGLKGKIIVLGWLDDRQRNALLALSDVCVMPSELEYFPYSLLEPMVCARPLVSSRIGCAEEMLKEGEDCLFFTPNRPDELATKVIELIRDPETAEKLGIQARQKVLKWYDWEKIRDQYADMYRLVLAENLKEKGA
jgi:glycosyltransferase involved in cell wall biosynthesis